MQENNGAGLSAVERLREQFGIPDPGKDAKPVKIEPKKPKKAKIVREEGIQPANGQTEKFGNKKIVIDGILFDSLKEGEYYRMLKFRKERGTIKGFEVHKRYKFALNGILICTLTVDFNVFHLDGKEEVIDVKSYATRMKKDYQIRKKMLRAWYGIELNDDPKL